MEMPIVPMLQVVTRVPLQLTELEFCKFFKIDTWPYSCPFLSCLFLSFFFYFLLFSSNSNTTSHNPLQALAAPYASFSNLLLLFPLNCISSFPHLLPFAFFFLHFCGLFLPASLAVEFSPCWGFPFSVFYSRFPPCFLCSPFLWFVSSIFTSSFCFGFLLSFCCYACFLLNW